MSAPEKVNEKAVESAKAFLSGLFMGLRTLQIHDPSNRAVENAIRSTYDAASALFAATGGFKIQFVDGTIFVNGARVRFDAGMFDSLRAVESALRAKQVGGFVMSVPPSFEAVRALILQLAKEGEVAKGELESLHVGALGLQSFAEDSTVSVDRRLLAVQSYAKLILALREQFQRVRKERSEGKGSPLRLRAVRIVQDVIELVAERPDFLLRMSTNLAGAAAEELHGVNTAMLAIAMGHTLGIDRRELVDLGMGGLFHHIGSASPDAPLDRDTIDASTARMLVDAGVARSSLLRAVIVAHQRRRWNGRAKFRSGAPHPFARIIAVASAYSQLASGFGASRAFRAAPLDALQILMQDDSGRFDPDLVAL